MKHLESTHHHVEFAASGLIQARHLHHSHSEPWVRGGGLRSFSQACLHVHRTFNPETDRAVAFCNLTIIMLSLRHEPEAHSMPMHYMHKPELRSHQQARAQALVVSLVAVQLRYPSMGPADVCYCRRDCMQNTTCWQETAASWIANCSPTAATITWLTTSH